MTKVAVHVVEEFIKSNPDQTTEEIRDTFVNACQGIGVKDIVETEEQYKKRRTDYPSSHTSQEITLTNGEKIYVTDQWRSKDNPNIYAFADVVEQNGWGIIRKV